MTNVIKMTIALLIVTLSTACLEEYDSREMFDRPDVIRLEDVGVETDSNDEEDSNTETDINVPVEEDVRVNTDTNVPEVPDTDVVEDTSPNTDTNVPENDADVPDASTEQDVTPPECAQGQTQTIVISTCNSQTITCENGKWEEGQVKFTCDCVPTTTEACSTGKTGLCAAGTRTCSAQGTWGACVQDKQPVTTGDCVTAYDSCGGTPSVGSNTCKSQGFVKGILTCGNATGTFDKSGCMNAEQACGDGEKDEGEACDEGINNVDTYITGYDEPARNYCTTQCKIATAPRGPYCGDNKKNGTEQCDHGTLGSSECTDQCKWTPEKLCEIAGKIWTNGQCKTEIEICTDQGKIWTNGRCVTQAQQECEFHGDTYHGDTGRCEVVCTPENTLTLYGMNGVRTLAITKKSDFPFHTHDNTTYDLREYKCFANFAIAPTEVLEKLEGLKLRKIIGSFNVILDMPVDPEYPEGSYTPSVTTDFLKTFENLVEVGGSFNVRSSPLGTTHQTARVDFSDLKSLKKVGKLQISNLRAYQNPYPANYKYDLAKFIEVEATQIDIGPNPSVCQSQETAICAGRVGQNCVVKSNDTSC